jgi:hypothetical protein
MAFGAEEEENERLQNKGVDSLGERLSHIYNNHNASFLFYFIS